MSRRSVLCPWLLLTLACGTRPPEQVWRGIKISVTAMMRGKELKIPGAAQPAQAEARQDLVLVDLWAAKKLALREPGTKVALRDGAGREYSSSFSQEFQFEDGHTEMKILFEIPEQVIPKTLELDEVAFDLANVGPPAKKAS